MFKGIRLLVTITIFIISICIALIGLYIYAIGYENLQNMRTLSTSNQHIVALDEPGHFLTKAKDSGQLLKERMEREGWTFKEQMGSGYMFTKDELQTVVTATIWKVSRVVYRGKYEIYKAADPSINIADN